MKVLVTGAKGQLGTDVIKELTKRGITCVGVDVDEMDITDASAVESVIEKERPTAVVHCAAWTAVDKAEERENREKVFAINYGGTLNIARACKKIGAKMAYISTDYVFSGLGETPKKPDDKDFSPLNVYGESKLAGEKAVEETLDKFFIIRIAWVFGLNGKNFIKTMLKLSETHDKLTVVSDQIGTPTYTLDLSRLIADIISTDKYGYYHATNSGEYISWKDFAEEIFRQAGIKTKVIPVSTEEYLKLVPVQAKRPFNSRLDKSKLAESGFTPLPDWKDAVNRYLKEIGAI